MGGLRGGIGDGGRYYHWCWGIAAGVLLGLIVGEGDCVDEIKLCVLPTKKWKQVSECLTLVKEAVEGVRQFLIDVMLVCA